MAVASTGVIATEHAFDDAVKGVLEWPIQIGRSCTV